MDDRVTGYWHVYSDGKRADIPFATDKDKVFVMNSIVICAYLNNMKVVCSEVNDTHLHAVVKGESVDGFRSDLKRRLTTYVNREGNQQAGSSKVWSGTEKPSF